MTTVVDRLNGGRTGFSVEFFPPRNDEEERILWRAVRELEPLDPAFVSVTYGAGGSSRDRTIRTTGRIAQETTLTPMAHLTAVDHSVAELRNVIGSYAAAGVRNVLAVRGDPPGDPTGPWVAHPKGLTYAEELVRLVRELGEFCVGVAAFPHGHPRSGDPEVDADHLVRKIDAGAGFAIAQLFLEPEHFLRLRDRMAARGCDVPLLPGVMPITTPKVLAKFGELAGVEIPRSLSDRLLPLADDPAAFRAAGVELVTGWCERLIAEGVPALHFYTLNRSRATREVVTSLGLDRRPVAQVGA
ncbi:methylenetetrahydrofolate reductase [NAD(P)H] [Saccharopolyspora griseoalba]|uniref:Methylenetetrahydrofolate reductase n=1 Tax=Saccharopolyspora griseoalba TaxID=1431848 RepID=A0ABW2LR02_9PSEU